MANPNNTSLVASMSNGNIAISQLHSGCDDELPLPLRYAGDNLGLGDTAKPTIYFVDANGQRYDTSSVEWVVRHIGDFEKGRGQVRLLAGLANHFDLAKTSVAGQRQRGAGAWVTVDAALPDDDTLVLLALNDDDVWPGFRDGDTWRYLDGMPITVERVTHWMPMPAAPTVRAVEGAAA